MQSNITMEWCGPGAFIGALAKSLSAPYFPRADKQAVRDHYKAKGASDEEIAIQLERYEASQGRRWYDSWENQLKRFEAVIEDFRYAVDPLCTTEQRFLMNDRVRKALFLAIEDIKKGWLSGRSTSLLCHATVALDMVTSASLPLDVDNFQSHGCIVHLVSLLKLSQVQMGPSSRAPSSQEMYCRWWSGYIPSYTASVRPCSSA